MLSIILVLTTLLQPNNADRVDGFGLNTQNPTFGSANTPLLWIQTTPYDPTQDDRGAKGIYS